MAVFKQHGFEHATVIGQVEDKQPHGLKVSSKGVL
jgi:hypothetical protein